MYLVATSPRSGSWLLCRGLRSLSTLGNPEEYLAAASPSYYLPRWGLPADLPYQDYLAEAFRRANGANGVLGVKAHWYQMRHCLTQLGRLPWDGAQYVYLRREDTLRQAISWWRALACGQWWRSQGMAAAPLDPLAVPAAELLRIATLRTVLREYDRAWRGFFADQRIKPLVLTYESLVADYAGSLRLVAAFMGVSAEPVSATGMERQADAATDVLAHRLIGYLRAIGAADGTPDAGHASPHRDAWWEV
jgi:LPS sulfotransferase NodH